MTEPTGGTVQWTSEAFAERLADYLAQRNTPWPDEAAMREAVRETCRLIFTEALYDTQRIIEALDRQP